MNAFATSEEPGGTVRPVSPASAPPPDPATAWREVPGGVLRWFRGIAGLDAYDRYVQHRSAHHPDEPLQGEAEFWRCRWDNESRNPKARCC